MTIQSTRRQHLLTQITCNPERSAQPVEQIRTAAADLQDSAAASKKALHEEKICPFAGLVGARGVPRRKPTVMVSNGCMRGGRLDQCQRFSSRRFIGGQGNYSAPRT